MRQQTAQQLRRAGSWTGTAACLLALMTSACKKKTDDGLSTGAQVPVVLVAKPQQKTLADAIDATGTFSSSQAVSLIARVQGQIKEINFKDGDWVKKGEVLIQLDDASYVQQVKLYQAQLLDAESEYKRQVALRKGNATSESKVETWLSKRDQAQAQVELAKIDLGYTTIIAPFDARVGKRYVDVGNVVGPGMPSGDKLVDIEASKPIYLGFDLSEHDLLRLRQAYGGGVWPKDFAGKVKVTAGLTGETGFPHQGILDFVDTSVSTSTGTILMRASLENEDHQLIPGFFARVRIPVGEPSPKLLVPERSVVNDQVGDFVMTVNDQDILTRMAVVKGAQYGQMRAISGSITAATQVVVGGQVNARPGVKVSPKMEGQGDQ